MKKHFLEILKELNVSDDIIAETPERAEKAYKEFFDGYEKSISNIKNAFYDSNMDEMIILKNIRFESFCEHHIVPIIGTAAVGYIPNGKIIGASKLARIVDLFAHRLQLQERMTMEIANFLEETINCKGVAVYVRGTHFCISTRGVRKDGAKFVTKYFTGIIKENFELRREFLAEIQNGYYSQNI